MVFYDCYLLGSLFPINYFFINFTLTKKLFLLFRTFLNIPKRGGCIFFCTWVHFFLHMVHFFCTLVYHIKSIKHIFIHRTAYQFTFLIDYSMIEKFDKHRWILVTFKTKSIKIYNILLEILNYLIFTFEIFFWLNINN